MSMDMCAAPWHTASYASACAFKVHGLESAAACVWRVGLQTDGNVNTHG